MITRVDIINQPFSGQYHEKIYDISSHWNSGRWTWIKFENDDLNEWCGEFRGSERGVSLSEKHSLILVLTSDYLYKIDSICEELLEYESQPQYQNLAVTSTGDFVLSDYYEIHVIETSLNEKRVLESPIEMDNIKFHNWSDNKLLITCDEFLNWNKQVELELDGGTLEIKIKNIL